MLNQSEYRITNKTSPLIHHIVIYYLQLVYVPCLVFFGTCGNVLCAIVFSKKPIRRIRSSSFLFLLAICDVFFLLDLLPGWINTSFIRTKYYGSNFICKIQTYISFVASFVHIWMVLAFTAERVLAVNFPLKHMSHFTPNISRRIILIIITPTFLFYIYPSFFASEVDQSGQCRERFDHVYYLYYINLIDTLMTMFLPFIFGLLLNVLIIRKLFCSKTFRQHVFENGSTCKCRRTTSIWSNYNKYFMKNQQQSSLPNVRRKAQHHDSTNRHILNEIRLTKMLVAISLTCLILNFPSYYCRLLIFYQTKNVDLSHNEKYTIFALTRDVLFHYLSYLSYSINILIYILFGSNFRHVLKRIVRCKKRSNLSVIKFKSFHHDNEQYSLDYSIEEHTMSLN